MYCPEGTPGRKGRGDRGFDGVNKKYVRSSVWHERI